MKLAGLIQEGKWDSITSDAVKRVMNHVKKTKLKYDKGKKPGKLESDGFYEEVIHEYREPLSFYLSVRIKREDMDGGFVMKAQELLYKSSDLSIVEVEIKIDPKDEPKIYTTLVSYLKDRLRHEIEHVTQHGSNRLPGRPKDTLQRVRRRMEKDPKNSWKYCLLPDEMPAMVHGMYAMAKHDKTPIDLAFSEQLDLEVKAGNITKQQKMIVMKKWIEYAKKHLTSAQFSKNY